MHGNDGWIVGVWQTLIAEHVGYTHAATYADCLIHQAEVSSDVTLAELPKKARLRMFDLLKRMPVPLAGTRGYPKAEVTAGGVCRKEVNPQTMESRLVPGLFFAGEVLDVDGPIGGFNFQAAFATGHTAALNIRLQ